MKKALALLLALVMVLALAACGKTPAADPTQAPQSGNNETPDATEAPEVIENFNLEGYPIVNEPVTLSIGGPRSANDMVGAWTAEAKPQLAFLEELTGVVFEDMSVASEAWEEQRGLMLTEGNMPDIFVGVDYNSADYAKYGADGVFMPLNDLIEKYMPNLQKCFEQFPDAKAMCTSADGNIYALPRVAPVIRDTHNRYWLNEKWVTETLGMEMPVTLEDYYNILVKSKETDLNGNGKLDEIPLSGYEGDAADGLFLNAYGINASSADFQYSAWEDGTVYCINTSDNYREYLRFMKKLYDEQLLDNEFLTQDQDAWRAKTKEARVMSCQASAMYIEVNKEIGYDWIQIDGLTTDLCPDGMTTSWQVISTKGAISTACERPEVAARLLDYFYSYEGGINAYVGVEGVSWKWYKDMEGGESHEGLVGRWDKFAPEGYETPEVYRATATVQQWPSWEPMEHNLLQGDANGNAKYLNDMSEHNSKWFVNQFPFKYLAFTAEDAEEYTALTPDLTNYAAQARAEFITGVLDLDKDWDKYVETMNAMGAADLCEMVQKYYTEYLAIVGG